jgi:DNA-binding MarR family transcriptional regulator
MGSHAISSRVSARDLEAGIMNAFRRVVRALRLGSQRAEADHGLSSAQLFVLQTLALGPAPSIAAIAERTLTDPSSVSVVVSRLVDRSLVERRTSTADGRRAAISLTRSGRALLQRAPDMPQARVIEALGTIGASNLRALSQGLEALVAAMGAESTPASMFFEDAHAPSLRKPGASQRAKLPAEPVRSLAKAAGRRAKRAVKPTLRPPAKITKQPANQATKRSSRTHHG